MSGARLDAMGILGQATGALALMAQGRAASNPGRAEDIARDVCELAKALAFLFAAAKLHVAKRVPIDDTEEFCALRDALRLVSP